MLYVNKNVELTAQLLQKMVHRFVVQTQPKLQKYKDYYDGIQAILSKSYTDETKPCNRTVTNYCSNIANSYCGYLATPSHISYTSNEDIEEIMDILRYNDYQAEDSAFLLDALIYGVAAELMYIDNNGKTRFRTINPTTCFGVYDDSLTNDLLYFVRMYKQDEWSDSNTYCLDVYSDYDIKHYTMAGLNGAITFVGEEKHFFSQCPANIFYLPDEKSIFDSIMGLSDTYNELLSAEVDEFSQFADCYLVLTGADLDAEEMATMKRNRGMVLPDGASVEYLTKQANDAQIENMLKRIHDSIYRIAQCPDFSSETFVGGVSSGIAIKYRLTGMETRAGKIEAEMKKALQRRIEIICGIASLRLGEEVYRDIVIDFKRNIPEDITATINMINSLQGIVSDATLLSQLPFVADVNAELEALHEQKQANLAMYSFAPTGTKEEEEEVEE